MAYPTRAEVDAYNQGLRADPYYLLGFVGQYGRFPATPAELQGYINGVVAWAQGLGVRAEWGAGYTAAYGALPATLAQFNAYLDRFPGRNPARDLPTLGWGYPPTGRTAAARPSGGTGGLGDLQGLAEQVIAWAKANPVPAGVAVFAAYKLLGGR